MTLAELPVHPSDRWKLHDLAEMLIDISLGQLRSRDPFRSLVASLMICTRPDCRAYAVDAVVDQLLAIADHRLGGDALAVKAWEVIIDAPARPGTVLDRFAVILADQIARCRSEGEEAVT